MMKISTFPLLAGSLLLLTGCDIEYGTLPEHYYDFRHDAHQWQPGFSDYPRDNADIYQLESGMRDLPTGFSGKGLYLAGMNRSDDLFMYIKKQITGLQPSTRYQLSVSVRFLTNAGADCMGVGGAPGESVYLKFGYAATEPKQAGYYLNADKGNQSQDGTQARVIGNVAAPGISCDGQNFASKTVSGGGNTPLQFTSNADGTIWVFIGTDSGYEGLTRLYYQELELRIGPR
ncbi:hypothetical protein SAMN05660691_01819 [Rheinheimera pacifica]|uniref:Lipoprotein n=1 Tax=Rheinheimera pacifica TaxID=173990 RepID=A0A1H6LL39_9GAMM|nr:hypothetical protein [Rheinheimera pacifica]SEH85542.1 hypothetical protein SAMN05660691_01819 [Rheinheimera pacifica]